jgi:hypothetical protein
MWIANEHGIFATSNDGAIRIILAEPRQCRCGRMVMFVVNRNGMTLCVECDKRFTDEQPIH